jgi:regulation of enolase protein 1 (concanavalin A-like superfamily)
MKNKLIFRQRGNPSSLLFGRLRLVGAWVLFLATAQAALPPGWSSADIGTVGVVGNANEATGIYTVNGGGTQMQGSIDRLHFAYQAATNNCSIIAKINSVQNTNSSARAGVIIRDNLNAAGGGQWVFMGFTPTWGGYYYSHNAGDGSNTTPAGVTLPYWVKVERVGHVFTGSISANGTTWTVLGSRTITMATNVYVGLGVCSYTTPSVLCQAQFSNVQTTGTAASVPTGWIDQDIGNTGIAGSLALAGNVFTVKGGGAGINVTDALNYASLPMSGNGTGNGSIVARLVSQNPSTLSSSTGLSGIMMRQNLVADSPYIFIGRNTWNQLRLQYHRPGNGWSEGINLDPCPPLPLWIKLDRTGNTFIGSYSSNGTTWTTLFNTSTLTSPMTMRTDVNVGMFACSSAAGTLATATFDNLATTGTNPLLAGWANQDLGTVTPAGSSYQTLANVYTVKGSGAGFSGNSDNGQFLYKAVTGDNQVVARVTSLSGATSTTAPAGLMIRDNMAPASKNVVLTISADKILRFQSHINAGDTTSTIVSTPGVSLPYWIKLARVGNVMTGYYSADGWNWQTAGSATVTLASNAYMGLAASSKTAGQLNTAVFDHVSQGAISNLPPATIPLMTDILSTTENPNAGLSLIDTIDTATATPVYQSATGVSSVQTILGKSARVLPTAGTIGAQAGTIAYVIGANKNLVAGEAYILTVEYPEDTARSIFLTNRGADYGRGWTTGQAVGDARQQYTEPTVESLNYPLSGTWKVFKQYFHLMERFQGVVGFKGLQPGWRPYVPANGFHVVISRMKSENDPRSAGAAVGLIRLYRVTNPSALYAAINYPPPSLPRRSIFWREEMGDIAINFPVGVNPANIPPADRPWTDTSDWYLHKMKLAKILGINTLGKDLLEFGYNQGFKSGDNLWYSNALEPNVDLWNRVVKKAGDEGLDLLPYYEYTGSLGDFQNGLGYQLRSKKLYYGIKEVSGTTWQYDDISWTANRNADVTDPDTLVDAKRLMDRTIGDFKGQARFMGAWFRTRSNCLPMGFGPNTIARFKTENAGDSEAQTATQATLISSYEGNKSLYNKYVAWWMNKRKSFLTALRDHLITQHGQSDAQVLFTPWTSETILIPHLLSQPYGYTGVVTDDVPWWTTYTNSLPPSWMRYHWTPTAYSQIVADNLYAYTLTEQPPINDPVNTWNFEKFHAAPTADPANYAAVDNVAITYPMGRLFTLENAAAVNSFRCASGLTVLRHYPLSEDNAPGYEPTPLGGQVGYSATESERAGNHEMLQQARAIAQADPRNLGYLCASSFNTGFPEVMRRFNQAFLAVPALPSTRLTSASTNANMVVRQITTSGFGTYYYVVNTAMTTQTATVTLPSTGTVTELARKTTLSGTTLNLTLESAELRAYRVGP